MQVRRRCHAVELGWSLVSHKVLSRRDWLALRGSKLIMGSEAAFGQEGE